MFIYAQDKAKDAEVKISWPKAYWILVQVVFTTLEIEPSF